MRINGILMLLILLAARGAFAHEGDSHSEPGAEPPLILGVLDFPTSGAPAAQDAFERGVKLLHSFEYEDARSAFLEAQATDPAFVMAIWGEAMTFNHPLWDEQDREQALAVLAKLPPEPERNATDLENRFVRCVQILYGDGTKPERDMAYRGALAQMHRDYPDDLEVSAFYALSILGSVYERDFRTYMQAAAVAEEIFARQPQHPGAAHYLIHSYDDQIHAPLGLRAARVYAKIAPAASHAQHMVSHIYTSLGMWDEVVEANTAAVRVSEEAMLRAGRSRHMRSKHALHWLEYALLQQGRYPEAGEALGIIAEDVTALPNPENLRHSAMMRATFAVEDPLAADPLAALPEQQLSLYYRALDTFTTAWTSLASGDVEAGRRGLEAILAGLDTARVLTVAEGLHETPDATSPDDYLLAKIMARELEALILYHEGDAEAALDILRTAVAEETSRPLYYGPPHVPKPTDELMGEMLLRLNRPAEAAELFQQALDRHTGRTLSLLGLARAEQQMSSPSAAETWQRLETQWRGDPALIRSVKYVWLPARSELAGGH
jgi:tetratricopeptide (TPR) repeat protein